MATYLESKADLSGNEFFFGCERDRISFLFSLFISLHFTIHYLSVCVHVCVYVHVYTRTCHSYTQLYRYIYIHAPSKQFQVGQVWKWEWLIGLRRNDSIVNIYSDDDDYDDDDDRSIVARLRASASALCLNFH